ncbi:MAG TPA: cytochrome c-type biogenesis protein CcmH [Myxococcaceae bacterium]|nr:cytochrome c-type biogenesis protein CcmH [Myxococcaceae bacterium]
MNAWVLGLVLATYAPQQAGSTPLDPEREARVQALGKQLRCPMCQGLSIADSNASAARAQMDKVRELVAAGRTDEQIRGYFTSRYGEWALLEPEASGMNLLVWFLPLLLLLGGGYAIARTMRRPASAPPAPAAEPEPEKGKEPVQSPPDDPWLEAVRAELRR